ncbi:hypothetical protein ROZALSC1DRAFT_30841 [Rozella allomycis CSF55]|uniref:Uncharacterized protein n=1 Tax=Rozella allomycis (strain CSF55) TaxID=988480 RepID=A0A4P9YDC5_ROZAC|nr:hypothetical protein ROZALSC1DRAFT_30841 [Rozella allomycis CSF55]
MLLQCLTVTLIGSLLSASNVGSKQAGDKLTPFSKFVSAVCKPGFVVELLEEGTKKDCFDVSQTKQHLSLSGSSTIMTPYKQSVGCVDARNPHHVIGSPGGDFAEFVSSFTTIYRFNKNQKYFKNMSKNKDYFFNLLSEFVKNMPPGRKFYLHTTKEAISSVFQKSIIPVELKGEKLTRALDSLSKSKNNGCGHIKYMLENPDKYFTPKELVKGFLQAFWRIYLTSDLRSKLQVDLYEGKLDAKAVVIVKHSASKDEPKECMDAFPAFVPHPNKNSTFVYHPQAAKVFRNQIVIKSLLKLLGIKENVYDRFVEYNDALHDVQMENTVAKVAEGLPKIAALFRYKAI